MRGAPTLVMLGWLAVPLASAAGSGTAAERPSAPLASYVVGRGEPTLVFVHGLGVDHSDWDAVLARLPAGRRQVTVDLPGHGATPAQDRVAVARVARALDRTLESLGVRRAVLVGHSYSGLVVLEAAAANPKRVSGVIVVDSGTYTPADSARLVEMDAFLTTRYRLFVRAVFGLMSVDSARAERLAAEAGGVPQNVLTAYFRNAWHEDLRTRVGNVRAPILLVATPAIWPVEEAWKDARERLGYGRARSLTARRIHGSGHFVTRDAPDSLAIAIAEFAAPGRR